MATDNTSMTPWRPRDWLFIAALYVAVIAAYQPALRGAMLWDDDKHVTPPRLRSLDGLWQIWSEPRATHQYYPLLHSAFWVEYRLWGDSVVGYHTVNILLHATAAALVALGLRRLKITGAYLAAGIFALHPVMVESVAWISEQKNTLSAVFYLCAALAYLTFDERRTRGWYNLALALFVLGLMSKTVTATLPGALLVIFWWQRGKLSWEKDVTPLLPFFAIGAVAGLWTAHVERVLIGAEGPGFDLSWLERIQIAGGAIWFYLAKLLWPMDLLFFYPRWHLSPTAWALYLPPLLALGLLAGLRALRGRSRAPLAALLFFGGTLFPVLGFCNVYPFLFSFVADHFQYLASLGVIALVAGGAAAWAQRRGWWGKAPAYVLSCVLLGGLAYLAWKQNGRYRDNETLYTTTLAGNPDCWIAHNNLGEICLDRHELKAAEDHFDLALKARPTCAEAHYSLGRVYRESGQRQRAMEELRVALKLCPGYPEALNSMGTVLADRGQWEEARQCYEQALQGRSDYAAADDNLGNALAALGHPDEALPHYARARQLDPNDSRIESDWAHALIIMGRSREAIEHCGRALGINPHSAEAYNYLGMALADGGQTDEGIRAFARAVELKPDYGEAYHNLGLALVRAGRPREALEPYRQALRYFPDVALLHGHLADALAATYQTTAAADHYRRAIDLARAAGQLGLAQEYGERLRAVEGGGHGGERPGTNP